MLAVELYWVIGWYNKLLKIKATYYKKIQYPGKRNSSNKINVIGTGTDD